MIHVTGQESVSLWTKDVTRQLSTSLLSYITRDLYIAGIDLSIWCPQCGTSLSDAEVEHVDRDGKYWYSVTLQQMRVEWILQ